VVLQSLLTLDKIVFLWCNTHLANPVLDAFFLCITDPSFWIIPGLIAASFFVWEKKTSALIVIGLVLIAAGISDALANQVIKHAVGRLRPCNPHALVEGGRFLLGYKTSLSFPSSHAMNMFAAAGVLTAFYRRQWYWFFSFALMIGFSRIYVGVHFPGDVLGGALFGAMVGWSGYFIFIVIQKQFVKTPSKTDEKKGAV
jgi:undecaprenyl-diphosphatase